MRARTIETLLKAANSSAGHDTSMNAARRAFLTEYDASVFFGSVRTNLFSISEWRKNSSATTYDLFDGSGLPSASDRISLGAFIRIKLHGSGKYDWVCITEIINEKEEVVMRVKPSRDPTDSDRSGSISHFFGPEAENNFCVQLNEKNVVFYVIGLNEKQNTGSANGLVESARNATIASVGYYSGLQNAVWRDFAANFLRTDEDKAD